VEEYIKLKNALGIEPTLEKAIYKDIETYWQS
jgi:hypothetical protein